LIKAGMILFGVGLAAIFLIMILFATGRHDLPWWLNVIAALAPVGFGVGLVAVFVEARRSRRPSAER
jgi:ABC-type multidrug transport system permease subunit